MGYFYRSTFRRSYGPRRSYRSYGGRSFRPSYRPFRPYGKPAFKKAFYRCRAKGGNIAGCLKRAKKGSKKRWHLANMGDGVMKKYPNKGFLLVWKKENPNKVWAVKSIKDASGEPTVPAKYKTSDWMVRFPKDKNSSDGSFARDADVQSTVSQITTVSDNEYVYGTPSPLPPALRASNARRAAESRFSEDYGTRGRITFG